MTIAFRSLMLPAMLILCWQASEQLHAQARIRLQSGDSTALLSVLEELQFARDSGDVEPKIIELPTGVYRLSEPLHLTDRLVGKGLRLEPSEGAIVELTGALPLEFEGRDQLGRWQYKLPEDRAAESIPRCLLVEGTLRSPARYPNVGYFRIEQSLPDRRSGFVFREGDLPESLSIENEVCDLVFLHDWSSSRLPVRVLDFDSRILKTLGPIGCSADHYRIDHFEKQPRYFLEGSQAFADENGEWFIDLKNQLVVLLDEEAKSPPQVEMPISESLIVAEGSDATSIGRLELIGIRFTGTSFPMPAGGMATAQATMHEPRDHRGERLTKDRPMLSAAVTISKAEWVRLSNCQFESLGNTGLWLAERTSHCEINGCRFNNLGANAINLGENNSRRIDGRPWFQAAPSQVPENNIVRNCEISQCGQLLPGSVGIWAALQHRLQLIDNRLDDCPYTGISLGWIWSPSESPAGDNLIKGNHIQRMMQVLSDGGGIYTLGRQPGSLIEDNFIHDIPLNAGRAESNGMFLDEGTTGFTIRNNVIRRTAKSPLRFHRAGTNEVINNQWDLPNESTPPVRFNSTPEANVDIRNNKLLQQQVSTFLIGNSLTWDTLPGSLDGNVRWHVDCGKPLLYIAQHPKHPCVKTSWLWPAALQHFQYDFLSVQPHYGATLQEDFETIVRLAELQPKATIVIHEGWPRHESLPEEFSNPIDTTQETIPMTHHENYYDRLVELLQDRFPEREIVRTQTCERLQRIAEDIDSGKAPFDSIDELYRDAIHMTLGPGRYLMHNSMRQALGQPISARGFKELDPNIKRYLDQVLVH